MQVISLYLLILFLIDCRFVLSYSELSIQSKHTSLQDHEKHPCPTIYPNKPTVRPSTNQNPTIIPTSRPSKTLSSAPSFKPSNDPTTKPSKTLSSIPSCKETILPTTSNPTEYPSYQPTITTTSEPSLSPTIHPTCKPSIVPSTQITSNPTEYPSYQPTITTTSEPSLRPTIHPTCKPSIVPSTQITSNPTEYPSYQPTITTTSEPSLRPTIHPTCKPSIVPSTQITSNPTEYPSYQPTSESDKPTIAPTIQTTLNPTQYPSIEPTIKPTISTNNASRINSVASGLYIWLVIGIVILIIIMMFIYRYCCCCCPVTDDIVKEPISFRSLDSSHSNKTLDSFLSYATIDRLHSLPITIVSDKFNINEKVVLEMSNNKNDITNNDDDDIETADNSDISLDHIIFDDNNNINRISTSYDDYFSFEIFDSSHSTVQTNKSLSYVGDNMNNDDDIDNIV